MELKIASIILSDFNQIRLENIMPQTKLECTFCGNFQYTVSTKQHIRDLFVRVWQSLWRWDGTVLPLPHSSNFYLRTYNSFSLTMNTQRVQDDFIMCQK